MTTLLGSYKNGNYVVSIYDNGTKIKETEADEFIAEFAESSDCKISNYCDRGCAWCHEDSTPQEKHGDILSTKFIDTLRPYTEMAIGGGNPLSHPDLIPFLEKLKEKKVIANMTVNQFHFMRDFELIKKLVDEKLIHGLGVSFVEYDDSFIRTLQQFPNAVLHVINGIVNTIALRQMYRKGLKILILGYKRFRRGNQHHSSEVEQLKHNLYRSLPEVLKGFKVVSFDNLALEQLDVKRLMSEEQWNSFYQGDDGSHTFYIDLVDRKFALNSTSGITYDLLDDVVEMFNRIRT